MLERKAVKILAEWKNRKNKKALIINGARQVGKTYSVREFAKTYLHFIELNFLESPQLRQIFEGSLKASDLKQKISLATGTALSEFHNALLFLDEVQECPNAITALKFLAAEEDLDVIATGSALGMAYNRVTSFPAGSIEYYKMHSLDFEEFLWAIGVDRTVVDDLMAHFKSLEKVDDFINDAMLQNLRMYMVVGGMPEVVQNYVDTGDLVSVHRLQRNIYTDYIADIARYAEPAIKIKTENCYKSIPAQLSKENHKFQYKTVEKNGTARKFENSLDWLINADMVIPVKNTSIVEYPLKSKEISDNVRIYPSDTGLLISTYDFSIKAALLSENDMGKESDNIILRTAKGGLYEALAADMLVKAGHEDLYFHRNDQGTAEIEFLLEGADGVIPVEVKAGSHSGRKGTKTLDNLLKKNDIKYGYKAASQNVGVSGKKITLPVYMCMFL